MERAESNNLFVANSPLNETESTVRGSFLQMNGQTVYCISGYDAMPPFLMSVVSSSDSWMFLSSTGGLTAGRRNSDAALFPYYPDDRVAENYGNTGPATIVRAELNGRRYLWEPFAARYAGIYRTTHNLYKNTLGTAIMFEEINHDLGLTFRYAWTASERFGFVRTSWLENRSEREVGIDILDGVQNILPYGATTAAQATMSNLLDAYKRAEVNPETGLAVYSLSSTLTDLAEPSESLLATTVFQTGLSTPGILLSSSQLELFRRGAPVHDERDIRGMRGAYFVVTSFLMQPTESRSWRMVADVEQDAEQIVSHEKLLARKEDAAAAVEEDIRRSDTVLYKLIAGADGLQSTEDHAASVHHFANVLFNVMRGGTFPGGYTVDRADLLDVVAVRSRTAMEEAPEFFAQLPEQINVRRLAKLAADSGLPTVQRLCAEYLPLAFSRRHGDPSRPWNIFSINVRNADGSRRYDYQGNWRDIFQNWEALAWSYPHYLEGMIFRFVNATTADGYNPYRVTRDGLEWETPAPDSPWANIGYWGDHQIIYLLKLLEALERFSPGRLAALLAERTFSYANVPYRIRPYEEICDNWYNTIIFDHELHHRIEDAVTRRGTDARLLCTADGDVIHVTLTEKLLVLLLVKIANLVPEGGIWMNTQRPEWNDANNALAGKGLSVVTAAYLRRFINFLHSVVSAANHSAFPVSTQVTDLFGAVETALNEHQEGLAVNVADRQRRAMMDQLGRASSSYRRRIYEHGLREETTDLSSSSLRQFLDLAQRFIERTIRANEREDGLYHAYNTLSLRPGAATVSHLYEMLEGQVAVLSSGVLSAAESIRLLSTLRTSRLYRADQHSYLLYPDRSLPGFREKNTLPKEHAEALPLVRELLLRGDRSLVVQDEDGDLHFNGRFRNKNDVIAALRALESAYHELVATDQDAVLELFETVFNHGAFTGRSGTFFGYEGLGSIYWHMVSKLLLAVQETVMRAHAEHEGPGAVAALREHYYDIREGLGFNKSPEVYGAFPTDPYSHSPAGNGARQPGMTGQVKEEILTRPLELGVTVDSGCLVFEPLLIRRHEFRTQPHSFTYVDVTGRDKTLQIPAEALAFTFCQVPIVVHHSGREQITAVLRDGTRATIHGGRLDRETSGHVFGRDGYVRSLTIETDVRHP